MVEVRTETVMDCSKDEDFEFLVTPYKAQKCNLVTIHGFAPVSLVMTEAQANMLHSRLGNILQVMP